MTDSSNGTTGQSETSWRNEYLKQCLQEHTLSVIFLKKDGTERTMLCTLKPDLIPASEESKRTKTPNPDVLPVWDLEANGWRSFRYDSILGFTVG